MNIFAGSRRIAYIIGVIATAATLFFAFSYEPYVIVDYSVMTPGGKFHRLTGDCPNEAAKHFFSTELPTGKSVSIDLCLVPMAFGKNNDLLIPYKTDDKNMTWGAVSYSNEVIAYKSQLERRFVIPEEDVDWVEKQISDRYWESFKDALKALGIGLAIFAVLVWAVGWITRGFMGIPHGSDRKPNKDS